MMTGRTLLVPCACGRSLLVDGSYSVSLTEQETAIVQLATSKPLVEADEIISVFWGHRDLLPKNWDWSFRVRLAKLRRKTHLFGFAIVRAPMRRKYRARWRMVEGE